jgi:ABC-type cobalamin/Fe3+-siderophores transport system ATPase subunit
MPDTILEARKVAIKRDDGHLIVEDVSFAIRAGDVAVLSGKSGSGKTTVLKALAHLIKYDGQILFHDR